MEILKKYQIDERTRIIIHKQWHETQFLYFILLQEKFLIFWINGSLNGHWKNNSPGYDNQETAESAAENYLKKISEMRMIQKIMIPRTMVIQDLEIILKKGHGRGNWKRLIKIMKEKYEEISN